MKGAPGCDAAALAPDPARVSTAAMESERTEAKALPTGPYVDWYESWRAQHGRRAAAEASAKRARERQVRWMVRGFAAWAAVVVAATLASLWWVAM